MIDILMTATIRPKVIRATLKSLARHIKYSGKLRLILNVDPIGEVGYEQKDIIAIANTYFSRADSLLVGTPSTPQYTKAIKWVLGMATSPHILYWEDDFELLNDLCLDSMVLRLSNDSKCGMIWFDKQDKPVTSRGGFRNIGNHFYLRECRGGIIGPPAIISNAYGKDVLSVVQDNEAVDITTETTKGQSLIARWDRYVYNEVQVKDNGKHWMYTMGLKKNKKTKLGMEWERNDV